MNVLSAATLNTTTIPISWGFYDYETEYPSLEQLQESAAKINGQVLHDLKTALKILAEDELLIPNRIVFEKEYEIHAVSVDDFCNQLWEIVRQKPEVLSIDQIGGRGAVLLPDGTKDITRDLVTLDDIRFCDHRQLQVKTFSSIWLPLSMNRQEPSVWQPELADLNAPRLSASLEKIVQQLNMEVEPAEGEIERGEFVWMKGFDLYINPELLLDEQKENPNIPPDEVKRFLLED